MSINANGLMAGKRGIILGVANKSSLAWGIAQQLHEQGAEIAFTYAGDALKKRVEPLAATMGADLVLPCDVTKEYDIKAVFQTLKEKWGGIDFILLAIGFSDKNQLSGHYYETTRDNFLMTMDISCFSLTAIAKEAAPIMNEGASILTLTYYGSEKVMPHYNVMGVAKAALEASVRYLATDLGPKQIRVNALSAGPVKTLAASGISDFRQILQWNEENAPLRRNIGLDEVGKSGLYLLSDLSSGVTGENHHVDCGYHTVGMRAIGTADDMKKSETA